MSNDEQYRRRKGKENGIENSFPLYCHGVIKTLVVAAVRYVLSHSCFVHGMRVFHSMFNLMFLSQYYKNV